MEICYNNGEISEMIEDFLENWFKREEGAKNIEKKDINSKYK